MTQRKRTFYSSRFWLTAVFGAPGVGVVISVTLVLLVLGWPADSRRDLLQD